MAKKDFSNVNTNPLYDAIQQAAEPMPGQQFLEGTEPAKVQILDSPVDATKAVFKDVDGLKPTKEPRETMKRNQPRAGKVPLYTYLEPAAMKYIDTMAGLQGVSRQTFINSLLLDAAENDPIYKQAQALRNKAQKGK